MSATNTPTTAFCGKPKDNAIKAVVTDAIIRHVTALVK